MLRFYRRLTGIHPEFPVYLAAMTLMAACGGLFENTYNNYLWEQFHLAPTARGNLELVREFPGLMNVVLMGAVAMFAETWIAGVSAVITAIGVAGFAIKGDAYGCMVMWTLLWGVGSHVIMPIQSSLTMGFGGRTKRGRRLGQVGAVSTVGSIAGAAAVVVIFRLLRDPRVPAVDPVTGRAHVEAWQLNAAFVIAAIACVLAAVCFCSLRSVGSRTKRPAWVLKRRYWLYYIQNLLFGARKQVFLTFGRWVLVVVFAQTPEMFAVLWIIASVVGLFFSPLVGRLVDRIGERSILMVDAVVQVVVCVGYGVGEHLPWGRQVALIVVCASFVVDQISFGFGMARATYISKMAETPEDLTASLSMGVSIDHLIAATIPMAGGWVWARYGYEYVFLAAGGVAVLMFFFATLIRVPRPAEAAAAP
jgi:hypothetical protein